MRRVCVLSIYASTLGGYVDQIIFILVDLFVPLFWNTYAVFRHEPKKKPVSKALR